MILALFAAGVLLADAATALQVNAAAPATAVPAAAAAKKADGGKIVCRNEPSLGTRLPTKRCRTAAQMTEQQRDGRATLERLQTITPANTR